jgi:predicted dehydrogenase
MSTNKKIGRRQFIENTAFASAVGALTLGALSSCKSKKTAEELGLPPLKNRAPQGKKLKAGLIGCGNRGTGALLNFLSAGPDLEVGALADVFSDKIESVRERLRKYKMEVPDNMCFSGLDGYKKLLESDVDVVLLATPPYFRPDHFKEAIQAKKHVFMEKPVAVDPSGIRKVIAAARTAETLGLNVVTGTQRRHQRDYIATYELVANGAIGKPLAAKAYWNQEHVWFRRRQEGWTDMEYMLRNWNNFSWLSGDHILDTHIHNIDVINWFMGKHPVAAIGYGGRHRRVTGNQFDFFSIDFNYGDGLFSHSMCRQIDNCANGVGELVIGTEGYTNCKNIIYDLDGNIKWQYEYPKDKDGSPMKQVKISPYIQEHIHLVTAIRSNIYVNEAERTAISNLTAIMGRESAYTGKRITWDEIMSSDLKLGPATLHMGNVEETYETPIPGTAIKS